jgi:hypothetical protein
MCSTPRVEAKDIKRNWKNHMNDQLFIINEGEASTAEMPAQELP